MSMFILESNSKTLQADAQTNNQINKCALHALYDCRVTFYTKAFIKKFNRLLKLILT